MREFIAEINEQALFADGFDDCVVGYVERFGQSTVALYDKWAIIDKLMKQDGMTEGEAAEYFEFNILGAYVGENTPCFMTRFK